jgi:hypothetical protein
MWPLRSHLLALLSLMTSAKVKWKWTPECQDSFEKMKAIMAKETLVTFPNFTKEFYSCKLQPAQTCNTTTERELLLIVETLQEFRNILLGQKIKVHTDHENLTYKTLTQIEQ